MARVFDDSSGAIDRFGWLLVVTVTAVVVQSLVDLRAPIGDQGGELGTVVFTGFVGATVLLSLRAAGLARRWLIVADILVGLAIALALMLLVADLAIDRDLEVFGADAPAPTWVVMSAIAPVVVVVRLLRHRHISRGTLLGAISALLLIAMFFTFVFLTIGHHQDAEFFGEPEPTTSYMYFSLVTITTLGYGDLSPATDLGRLMASAEAVIGQIYLVTFVAFLVSLYATRRQRDPVGAAPGEAHD